MHNKIDPDFLAILACPTCKSSVIPDGEGLICTKCQRFFPVIEEDIPVMLPQTIGEDMEITREKWDEQWHEYLKSSDKRSISLEKDPELLGNYNHVKKFWKGNDGLLLEIGCGPGKNLCLLAKEEMKVVGIDISTVALRHAKRLFKKENVNGWFVCADVRNLPFKDHQFSFIYGGGVIEHFRDTLTSVMELKRCLKRGGVLSQVVPSVSLSTPYLLLRGNIPDIFLIKHILEFFHVKLSKGRFMPFGYEKSFTISQITKIYRNIGLRDISSGLFDTHYALRWFKSDALKRSLTRLGRKRPFWGMVYVNGVK